METLKFINGHPTKRALICYVLLSNGPQTRISILKTVHALESSKLPFQPTSNIAYFLRDRYKNPWCDDFGRSVLIGHGKDRPALITHVTTVNRFHVYDLLTAGRELAQQVVKWMYLGNPIPQVPEKHTQYHGY